MKKSFLYVFAVAIFLCVIDCGRATPQEATIKLNPKIRLQKMTGWEATAQTGEHFSPAFAKYRDKLLNDAVNDLGINRLRLEIRSGIENPTDFFTLWQARKISESDYNAKRHEVINDNEDPNLINPKGFQFTEIDSTIEKVVLPMKALLKKRNEALYVNLNFVDFGQDRGTSNIRHNDNPEEYAELMLATYQHIEKKYGFVPDAIEVILEPDNSTGWTGLQIGAVIVSTAKRLQDANFTPRFIVPSTTNAANAPIYIDEIAKVPGAMKFISEFSYHRYCCASEEVLGRIADRAEKYGKQTAMLELIGADYNTLHQDLKTGRNSSWEQYVLAGLTSWGGDNGGAYFVIDDSDSNDPKITLGSRARFFRQYFRYIRVGAQRIGAESNNANFDSLAFVNADGKYVLVTKADVPGTITVSGLPTGTYGISYTTEKETGNGIRDVTLRRNETLKATIPAAGVITIFAKEPENKQ